MAYKQTNVETRETKWKIEASTFSLSISSKNEKKNDVCCMVALLKVYFLSFFSICHRENFKCLIITVHEILPRDRRTGSGVLRTGSRFSDTEP